MSTLIDEASSDYVGTLRLWLRITDNSGTMHDYKIPNAVYDAKSPFNILAVPFLGQFFGANMTIHLVMMTMEPESNHQQQLVLTFLFGIIGAMNSIFSITPVFFTFYAWVAEMNIFTPSAQGFSADIKTLCIIFLSAHSILPKGFRPTR